MKIKLHNTRKLRAGLAFASLLLGHVLAAQTVAHWKFGENAADGARINKVEDNNLALAAAPNRGPRASTEAPPAGSAKTSAAFAPDGKTGACLVSGDTLEPLNFPAAFTIEGWFKLGDIDPARPQCLLSNRGKPDGLSIAVSQGKFFFQVQANGTALVNLAGKTELEPDTWYYFAVTRDDAGRLTAAVATAAAPVETVTAKPLAAGAIDSDSKTYIGRWGDRQGAGGFLNGKISEIRVSNGIVPADKRLLSGQK